MTNIRYASLAIGMLAIIGAPQPAAAEDGASKLPHRWVYLSTNLQVAENVAKVEPILRRAARAGYNGVVLADYKLNILDRVPDHYFRNAAQFRKLADELKLEVVPCVAAVGYSDGILAHNPNLAEGLPVKDAEFVVRDGVAELVRDAAPLLPGGDFEQRRNDAAAGWGFQDGPGRASFIDTAEKHGGANSLRFENLGQTAAPSGNGRVSRPIAVRPWRQYHARAWIKTRQFESAGDVKMFALGAEGRTLSHSNLGVKRDQEWTEHHIVFNSLENTKITFYLGTWGGRGGTIWFDDVRLEEEAFVNLLRRDGCPLTVTDEKGKPLVEGKDFAALSDPKMGQTPWAGSYDVYHEPPRLKAAPGGRIQNGAKLRVGYYHTVTIYDNQATCCLAHPEVFAVIEDQVRRVDKLFAPRTYFMSHDEIRLANWCQSCRREGRTAGQLLAENVRRCAAIVRRVRPGAELCVWSDMFDPHHNAKRNYYLVDGDLAGSWEGLPTDVTVMNWNHDQAAKSLPWFAERGHRQILAGFYDSSPGAIADWLRAGGDSARVSGVMYSTWRGDFTKLEAFAKAAWGK